MKRMARGLALLAVLGSTLAAQAQAQGQAQRAKRSSIPQFVEVKARDTPFAVFRVDGMISGLRNARASDVIATFYPMHPIVGLEHLAPERRFDVDIDPYATTSDLLLTGLSRSLGVSVRDVETTAEFLIVRNGSNPIPKGWVHVTEPDLLNFGLHARGPYGITQIDPTDGYHTAYFTTMPEFAHFLSEHSSKPVWNQTALLGHYCFSFRLHGGNLNRTLADMGFDIVTRQGTTRCVVATPLKRAN